jgi:hypothetical protein
MQFELKNVDSVGAVTSKDADTSSQWLNITVGVVGCPYGDIVTTKTIAYEFANSITVAEAKAGVETFATAWIAANYPNI